MIPHERMTTVQSVQFSREIAYNAAASIFLAAFGKSEPQLFHQWVINLRALCIITPYLQTEETRTTMNDNLCETTLISLHRVIQFTINELSCDPECDFHELRVEEHDHTEKEREQTSWCSNGSQSNSDTMTTCHIPMTTVVQPCPLPSSPRSAIPGSRGSCAEQYTASCPTASCPRSRDHCVCTT